MKQITNEISRSLIFDSYRAAREYLLTIERKFHNMSLVVEAWPMLAKRDEPIWLIEVRNKKELIGWITN